MAKQLFRASVVICFLTMIVLAAVPTAQAQFAETTGSIQGNTKDQSGASVPGALVALTSGTAVTGKSATTDKGGYFRFAELPPGIYAITATAHGFSKYVESGIAVDVGKTITLDIELKVGDISQTVEVSAAAVQVDVTSNKALTQIGAEEMALAPHPRGVLSLIERAPGARNEPALGGFSMDGASASENTYAVEGQDTTQIYGGLVGVNPPTDFFKEVTIKSSGYEAEYGGAMGGVVQLAIKSGGSAWHGDGLMYYRQNSLDSTPRYYLRTDPSAGLAVVGAAARFGEPVQVYHPKQDKYRIFDPGFDVTGPILKDHLFLYASYIPDLNKTTRMVNIKFPGLLGPRSFSQTFNTQFAAARLDGNVTKTLHAFGVWDDAYSRSEGEFGLGSAPGQDDINGLVNVSAASDPRVRRQDRGRTYPNVLYRGGADWTPTSKIVITGAAGRWFTDAQDRGIQSGIRHVFNASNIGLVPLNAAPPVPAGLQHGTGFSDIPNNSQQLFDQFARTQSNVDASYVFHALGNHTVKGGYAMDRLSNNILQTTASARVDLYWGQSVPVTGPFTAGCAPFIAANGSCRGNYGYWRITDFQTRGKVSSDNHGLYFQDSYNPGHGLTINAGVRFDKEFLPSFTPTVLNPNVITQPIQFGFGSKVSPRIGGAYDVLHNGKLKVYGSFGWFYDIMKYSLPQGSFGGQYWHNCVFTLDNADYTAILPAVKANNFTCHNGGAGAIPGTLVGEEDLRIPSNIKDPTCPTATPLCHLIDPKLQPVRQTEFTAGSEWAISPNMSFEVRWAHKRLRNTIEDSGLLGAAGETFLIVNPGERLGQFPITFKSAASPGDCAIPAADPTFHLCTDTLHLDKVPQMPKAVREYDGIDFIFNKRFTHNYWVNASYTWSRLNGDYSGLSSSDEDAAQQFSDPFGLGRADPNNNRSFDEQEVTFQANGKPSIGPLPTDRPHTFKAFGGYQLKWLGMLTTLSANQAWYIGAPRSTRIQVVDVDIAAYMFGRGNLAHITQDPATGNWILSSLQRGAREPMYTNTDLSLTHEFKVSKTNEALRLSFNITALNAFNQATKLTHKDRTDRNRFDGDTIIQFPDPTCGAPGVPLNAAGNPCASQSGMFRQQFFAGIDPIATANGNFSALGGPLRLASLYGLPIRIAPSRALRLGAKFSF